MEPSLDSDEETFVRDGIRGIVRQHHFRQRFEENRRQNEEDFIEYVQIAREIVEYQMGHRVYTAVLSIVKTILVLVLFMLVCFLSGYEWIPRILTVLMMIATGLRYCWLKWHGRRTDIIRIPID